jgi:hypothetical protein
MQAGPRGAQQAFSAFPISVRGTRVGPEILQLGKHSLQNLEPRSRPSYVADDTRVWAEKRGLGRFCISQRSIWLAPRNCRGRKAFLRSLELKAGSGYRKMGGMMLLLRAREAAKGPSSILY